MAAKKKFASEALQYTYDRFIAGDEEQESLYEQTLFDTEVASMIYDLRTKAGLSPMPLSFRATTQADKT